MIQRLLLGVLLLRVILLAQEPLPRRIGVRPTGTYWGAQGEQIDMLSGNLNVTVPLLRAQARGGWGLTFQLSYNSQVWKHNATTGISTLLGVDLGYGFGWKLQIGSVTPVSVNGSFDHYMYSDSTGAEYRLDQNVGNKWTSHEGLYVTYDANANKLYFSDGTFWNMFSISSQNEPDAGTRYPTLIQDTNGNQLS